MIKITQGDMFEGNHEALVNTVNTTGIMGAGIAKAMVERFPVTCGYYNYLCRRDELLGGSVKIYENKDCSEPKYIVMFATKQDISQPSEYEYIEDGLKSLVHQIKKLDIKNIGIPALGSGLGGLDWDVVMPMIVSAMEPLTECDITIYQPL